MLSVLKINDQLHLIHQVTEFKLNNTNRCCTWDFES